MRLLNSGFRKAHRGVALIFFAMIFGVFLGFTMLVMYTGLMVFQKVRLQSATDLAAYAGASVQASYLGNSSSGEDGIKAINNKIQRRYQDLLDDMDFGTVVPWAPGLTWGFPDPVSCTLACGAATMANAQYAIDLYEEAVADIAQDHQRIRAILAQMPEATQKAVERTMALNIPELNVNGGGGSALASAFSQTTNSIDEVTASGPNQTIFENKKNAVLTLQSQQGLYLAVITAGVPHSYTRFDGPCFNAHPPTYVPNYYCNVNGSGAGGGPAGFAAASVAATRGAFGGPASGNVGRIERIVEPDSNAIRLGVVEDVFRPRPHVVVATEWYPENGSRPSFENSLGAAGTLLPTRTRLVAVAAAEPFGSALATNYQIPFGTRLTGIRKALLDPRLQLVRSDYNDTFRYMEFLGQGEGVTAEDVIRRFLH